MYSYQTLLDENRSVIEAYNSMRSGNVPYIHPEVKTKIVKDENVIAHHFSPEDRDRVHEHLVSKGFKQAGASTSHGSGTETRYVHPETKQVAYIGNNKHTGWLDIQR